MSDDLIWDGGEIPGPPEPEPPPNDYNYPWIVAWGRRIQLTEDQIDRMVRRAQSEHAPATAIYKFTEFDPWATLDGVTRPETRYWLLSYARNFDLTIPDSVMAHWLDPDYEVPSAG